MKRGAIAGVLVAAALAVTPAWGHHTGGASIAVIDGVVQKPARSFIRGHVKKSICQRRRKVALFKDGGFVAQTRTNSRRRFSFSAQGTFPAGLYTVVVRKQVETPGPHRHVCGKDTSNGVRIPTPGP
jgi:hypothetical protein